MTGSVDLSTLPGPLAAACRAAAGKALVVGGAVRDLAWGREVRDLDLLSLEEVRGLASSLAEVLDSEAGAPAKVTVHEGFGTASVSAAGLRVDLATARTESYPVQGDLPRVSPGATVEEDLRRRDFTVNSLVADPADWPRAPFSGPEGAVRDLEERLWRVFHHDSLADDPTRVFRLARYRRALGGELAGQTEASLAAGGWGEAATRVAPARWRAEVEAWSDWGLEPSLGGEPEERALTGLFGGTWVRGVEGSVAGFLAAVRGQDAPAAWERLGARRTELSALAPLADPGFPGFGADADAVAVDSVAAGWDEIVLGVAARGREEAVAGWRDASSGLERLSGEALLALGVAAGPEIARWQASGRRAALRGEAGKDEAGQAAWVKGRLG